MGQARKSLWIETAFPAIMDQTIRGQARKSLWIETIVLTLLAVTCVGQARKSLWIETSELQNWNRPSWVRLVRACGSKHPFFAIKGI